MTNSRKLFLRSVQAGIAVFILSFTILFLPLIIQGDWLHGTAAIILTKLVLYAGLFFLPVAWSRVLLSSSGQVFRTYYVTIAVFYTLDFGGQAFLHHYLDVNYKYQLADRKLEQRLEKNEEIEREKNVTIEFDHAQEEKRLLRAFSLPAMTWNYVFSLLFGLLVAVIFTGGYRLLFRSDAGVRTL